MQARIALAQLRLWIVAGCLWRAALASTEGGLLCQEESGQKPGELRCSFKVDTTQPMKDFHLEHCTTGVCVSAVASIAPESQSNNDKDTNDEDHDDDDTTSLKIGMATYRKPFANYYPSEISKWLNQAPKTSSTEDDPLEWARWSGTLGTLHVRNYKGRYDLELAIIVLEKSIQLVEDHFEITLQGSELVGDYEWDSFRATVYSNLGEAYYLDPELKHGTEALDHYEKALTIYQSLIENHEEAVPSLASSTPKHDSTRQVYALTLAKLGSALIHLYSSDPSSLLDSIDNNQDMDGAMADMASTTTISNFNENDETQSSVDPNETIRPPKLERASQVLTLALEFYEKNCRKHLPADQKVIPKPSEYVEACVDYATTLQYSATVESLSGNYQGALDYMTQALLVYTAEKKILHQEPPVSSAFVDLVLATVYSTWYQAGSTESIGSMLVNIADTCGQLGKHEESKTNYKLAMRFYSAFHVPPPPTSASAFGAAVGEASMNQESKALLDSYLTMLREYRSGAYQKDDTYEGDVLYNIGTMYHQYGDEKESMEWFEQAVAVYERIHKPGTYDKNRKYSNSRWSQIASIKASLTRMYFGQGRFDDSIRAHEESMDLFLELYGDGVNPYVQFLHEQIFQAAEGGVSANDNMGGKIESETAINLENYLQSIKNATEKLETAKGEEKKKKDEL